MPVFEMPLEELKVYEGRNPCPPDIDAYWDKALQEMRSIDPKVELVPSDYQVPCADCFDLYFTGARGARIHAKYLRPKGKHSVNPIQTDPLTAKRQRTCFRTV